MRKVLLILLLLPVFVFSQVEQTVYKTVSVFQEHEFYLNSYSRIGGKSRTYVPIDLPQNTVSWYYAITVENVESNTKNLGLFSQVTKLATKSNLAAGLIQNLFAPTGSAVVDVYFLDRSNISSFVNKEDYFGNGFTYSINNSRMNLNHGVVEMNEGTGSIYYLGIRNTSPMDGKRVRVEAVAIVEEKVVDNAKWTSEAKDQLYKDFKDAFEGEMDKNIISDVAMCITNELTHKYTPEDVAAMSEMDADKVTEEAYELCVKKILGISANFEKAAQFGSLGWRNYESGDLDNCIVYSLKALHIDKSLAYVRYNLGLCYLAKGDLTKANEYYIDALVLTANNKLPSQSKAELSGAIKDINDLLAKKPGVKGANEMKKIFEEELKSYE